MCSSDLLNVLKKCQERFAKFLAAVILGDGNFGSYGVVDVSFLHYTPGDYLNLCTVSYFYN